MSKKKKYYLELDEKSIDYIYSALDSVSKMPDKFTQDYLHENYLTIVKLEKALDEVGFYE